MRGRRKGLGVGWTVLFGWLVFASVVGAVEVDEGLVKDFRYVVDAEDPEEVELRGGVSTSDVGPMEEGYRFVTLVKYLLEDFNRDGCRDAAVVLVTSRGGSGAFVELSVLMGGRAVVQTPPRMLGDRVVVKRLFARTGGRDPAVCAEMLVHGSRDPQCCPTKGVIRCFSLLRRGGRWMLLEGR